MDVRLPASPDGHGAPVVLLTSGATFSAGETFVLALRERPAVTVLGERTSGHLSDLYDARLPNGWRMTWSGEQYRAADGGFYEAVGVPVDVEVPFDPEEPHAMFDAAVTLLR